MANQVHVTMVSMTGNIYPVERVINLSPDHPTIEIGRASKSLNKGIVSAEDNAWFDSPVMSRAHAKLTLDINDNSVTLVDVGSMHGTLVNNQPLKVNERTTLRDNDIVVFGTQVTRGSETIPPCAFRVNYEYSPYNSKNETMTFAFPDSSDVDEDYDVSENEARDMSSSGDGLSTGSPGAKTPSYMDAIDLTSDDNPQSSDAEASSQLPRENSSEDHLSGNAGTGDGHSGAIRLSPIIVLDSVDENEHEHEPVAPNTESNSDESVSESLISMQEYSVEAVVSFSGGNNEEYGARSMHGLEDVISDFGSESELGLSDAEEEGLRAFRDLSGNKNSSPRQEPTNDVKTIPSILTLAEDNETTAAEPKNGENEPVVSSSSASKVQDLVGQPSSTIRQPSPSDAAMVKPTATHGSNPIPVHHLPSNEWKSFAAQSLQEKTNKYAADHVNGGLHDDLLPPFHPYSVSDDVLDAQQVESRSAPAEDIARDRSPGPVPCMTDTVSFNESQAVMTGAVMDSSPQSSRSGLRINDIIDSLVSLKPETHKRKAEDISDVLVDEIQAWASVSTLDSTKNGLSTACASPPKAASATEPLTASAPVLQEREVPATRDHHSNKRLKKVVEGAAYIALGGVGLFSLLVATAPDFM